MKILRNYFNLGYFKTESFFYMGGNRFQSVRVKRGRFVLILYIF